MTEESSPKLPRTSISRIETFAACARYDYYQVVLKLPTPQSPYQEEGNLIHAIVESQFSSSPKPLLGAASQAMRYYPLPGQDGVEIERKFDAAPYAGALLYAKIDCYVPPGAYRFGALVRPPKSGLARIIDLKSTASRNVRYKEDATQLDTNRQLLAYVRVRRPEDKLIEVSQVVVGRDAPHNRCGPVRIVSQQQAVDQEGYDSSIVTSMVASRKAESPLDLPAAAIAKCENWYGKKCDFYERCHGAGKTALGTRSWSDILTASDQDGRGGEGTRAALDQAVRDIRDARETLPMDPSKPTPPAIGKIGSFTGEYRFLSNFYTCIGSSVEHLYQALKCADPEEARAVMSSPTPGKAKRLGRRVTMRSDWEQVKVSIMTELVRMKFQDQDLRSRLLATGDAELVEGNDWGDSFWGFDWKLQSGRNELGKILMRVREEYRNRVPFPHREEGESVEDFDARVRAWTSSRPKTDVRAYAYEVSIRQQLRKELEKIMSLVNPPDANQNHTSRTLAIEGPVQILNDVLQGKPYCNVVGKRHGRHWEFRALLNDWKFLVGGEATEVVRPKDGKTITKITGGTLKASGTAVLSEDGKQDVDLIRRNALHPQLQAWDLEVNPSVEEESTPTPEPSAFSVLDEIEAQQKNSTHASVDTASEVSKLESCGCTPYQSQKMVEAGITDARLRAGTVTQQELEALPKFGPGKAQAILDRYADIRKKANGVAAVPEQTNNNVGEQDPAEKTIVDAAIESGKLVIVPVKEKTEDVSVSVFPGFSISIPMSDVSQGESVSEVIYLKNDLEDVKRKVLELEQKPTTEDCGYDLYIDCLPVKGMRSVSLEEVLLPYLTQVAADRNVPDVLCLKAFEWPGLLLEKLFADPPTDTIAVSVKSSTKEWDAVRRFFLDRARVVVQGLR